MGDRDLTELVISLLLEKEPNFLEYCVCVECKLKHNICVLIAYNEPCMGPVTNAGCGALCQRSPCYDCLKRLLRDALTVHKKVAEIVTQVGGMHSIFKGEPFLVIGKADSQPYFDERKQREIAHTRVNGVRIQPLSWPERLNDRPSRHGPQVKQSTTPAAPSPPEQETFDPTQDNDEIPF